MPRFQRSPELFEDGGRAQIREVTRIIGVASNICDEKIRRAACDAQIGC